MWKNSKIQREKQRGQQVINLSRIWERIQKTIDTAIETICN